MKNAVLVSLLVGLVVMPGFRESEHSIDSGRYGDLDTLAEILTLVKNHAAADVANDELVEGAIQGLLEQLDPHSVYYNAERYRIMKEDQRGSFYGIGINIGMQNKELTVIAPMEGTPASRAGLRAGDVIVAIDGEKTDDMSLDDAIRRLRGEVGDPVRVSLRRAGVSETWEVTLIRAEIPSNNVRSTFLLPGKTGYVGLRDFGEMATEELAQAIEQLTDQGMTQLILDLRGNPGGLLPQAIGVAGLFVPGEQVVVSTKGRLRSSNQDFLSEPESPITQMPLIVLIDRGSASASEIVAGAIQDHDRGLIVGVTSWGKGLVQSVFPIGSGSQGLALTTARYYTPSGRHIQGRYESFDDYYHPELNDHQSEHNAGDPWEDAQVFLTDKGRRVPQVRGIVPDVYLAYPEVPVCVQKLEVRHNAFFNFATQYQDRFSDFDIDAPPGDACLRAFEGYVKKQGLTQLWQEAIHFPDILTEKLVYQLLFFKNREKAWKYLMSRDYHVKLALDLFPKARELFSVFSGQQRLRSEYATELKQYAQKHAAKREP